MKHHSKISSESMKINSTAKQKKKYFILVLMVACICVLIFNATILINWFIDSKTIKEEAAEVTKITEVAEIDSGEPVNPPDDKDNDYWNFMKLPLINVDIAALKNQNPETVGFINVPGTSINYPVVQTTNNDDYLRRSFRKERNNAGWIFMDYRNDSGLTDQNTIIYGHGRLDSIMFGTLKNILNTNWINNKDNHVVRYVSETETMLFQVFSVYTVPAESLYIQTRFGGTTQYKEWLNNMIGRSKYNFNTTVNENDQVLTLSTCYNNDDVRVVMQAKLIKKDYR